MNTRIQKFIEGEGLTAARFADIIGVQRSNVSHVLSGRNKPSYDFIEKMLGKFPELNAEWLILGKGAMYKESHMPSLFDSQSIVAAKAEEPVVKSIPLVNTQVKDSNPPIVQGSAAASEKATSKKLVRVLLCYSDGTFEIFDSNNSGNQLL